MGQSPTNQCVFLHKKNQIYNEEKTIIFLNSATKYRVAKFLKFHKIMGYLFYCPLSSLHNSRTFTRTP